MNNRIDRDPHLFEDGGIGGRGAKAMHAHKRASIAQITVPPLSNACLHGDAGGHLNGEHAASVVVRLVFK